MSHAKTILAVVTLALVSACGAQTPLGQASGPARLVDDSGVVVGQFLGLGRGGLGEEVATLTSEGIVFYLDLTTGHAFGEEMTLYYTTSGCSGETVGATTPSANQIFKAYSAPGDSPLLIRGGEVRTLWGPAGTMECGERELEVLGDSGLVTSYTTPFHLE